MNDLVFDNDNSFNNYINNYENIGKGCFLIDDKYVVKKFDDEYINKYSYMVDKDVLLRFSSIEIEHVYFPKSLLYINGKICGYITNYISGKNGNNNYFKEIKIEKLLGAIERFMVTIKKISDLGIKIIDPYVNNIVFDGDNFNLIDMSECEYVSLDKDIVYEDNIINVMYEIFIDLFESNNFIFSDCSISSFLSKNKFDNDLYSDENLLSPVDTINRIKSFLETIMNKNIDYFIEVDKYLLEIGFGNEIIREIMDKIR